ncbi:HlyD family secretion protein [Marinobacter subterrani]|uniref:HlyD family secretion protein n=1 Tax=Marinobacter subterrani TaxID=1658765 RepID=A0A0J7J3C5_9GAMM|nr:HlyD family efflux transporter periplasmic adaptor subunit [Marinobacter subterrani]KMQ72983.1 HlyD family secretion protein [Marinobacter subterrani]
MTPSVSGTCVLLVLIALTGCNEVEEYPVVGTLERDRIALTAERAEPVTAIHVREGQPVAAGTLLVEQDPRRLEADLARLEAAADRTRRRLDELLRGPRQEVINEARARLMAAGAALEKARNELQRIAPLQARNLASVSQLDAARNARDQARGEVEAASAALAALLEGTTTEELDQARAAVREAEAVVEGQRLTLDRLNIVAPRAALVESLPFEQGETPRPGEALALLRATDQPPYARVYVPAALHHQFQPGDTVQVSIDGHGRRAGQVRYIASEAAYTPYFALTEHDAGRLSYLVEIDLKNAEELPSGIPVRVVVPGPPAGGGDE